MLASIARMIVSKKMKHAVRQQPTHLPVVTAAPVKSLTQGSCWRDHDLTEKKRSALALSAVLEAQHIRDTVSSSKPPVQVAHCPVPDKNDRHLTLFHAKGVEDSGTE